MPAAEREFLTSIRLSLRPHTARRACSTHPLRPLRSPHSRWQQISSRRRDSPGLQMKTNSLRSQPSVKTSLSCFSLSRSRRRTKDTFLRQLIENVLLFTGSGGRGGAAFTLFAQVVFYRQRQLITTVSSTGEKTKKLRKKKEVEHMGTF